MPEVDSLLSAAAFLRIVWPSEIEETTRILWGVRFPALAAVVLLGLPIYASVRRREFLAAIISRGWVGAAATTAMAWVDGAIVALTSGTMLRVGAERFGAAGPVLRDETWRRIVEFRSFDLVVPALLIVPTAFVLWRFSERRTQAALGILAGIVAGVSVSGALAFFRADLGGVLQPLVERLRHESGYVVDGKIAAGHVLATGMLFVLIAIYVVGYFRLHPTRRLERKPPLMFYFWFLLGIFALILPGMSFFLDDYRVPTIVVLLIAGAIGAKAFRKDHFFDVSPVDVPQPTVEDAIAARASLERSTDAASDGDWRIFVCAWGGGIQAAAWTARVLTGLQVRYGERFPRRIALVSGVSGGSVGLLKWLHGVDRATGIPHPDDLETIFDSAVRPSLDEAAWGMAFPDLLRMVFPPAARTRDRAWAVEQAWIRHLERQAARMSGDPGGVLPDTARWRRETAAGTLPIVAFNTVTVEQGRHVSVATAGPLGGPDPVQSLASLYERDLEPAPVTAARLSATFPVLTPVARARIAGERESDLATWHFADGGYFDNGGVYTAVRTASAWLSGASDRKVLLLEIEGFPRRDEPPPSEPFGWIRNTLAPLETIVEMRGSAQRERGKTEVGLFSGRYPGRVEHVVLRPEGGEPPLTWHLEDEDVRSIREEWRKLERSPEVERIGALL